MSLNCTASLRPFGPKLPGIDDSLNALEITERETAALSVSARIPSSSSEPLGGRFDEPTWALGVGLLPFVTALLIKAAIGGWTSSVVDVPNLGFCLFAVSLAVFVRVASHGRGQRLLVLFFSFAVIQAAYALYYGGTFDKPHLSSEQIRAQSSYFSNEVAYVGVQTTVDTEHLRSARQILNTLATNDHPPSATVYVVLTISGAISILALLVLWSPLTSRSENG